MRFVVLLCLLCVAACRGDETLTAYGAAGSDWVLTELDGQKFDARAVVQFPEQGKVQGIGPCNSFSARQTAPYPWIEIDQVASTKRGCADQKEEARFLKALTQMTLVEVSGPVLILSNDLGRRMIFRARPPAAQTR